MLTLTQKTTISAQNDPLCPFVTVNETPDTTKLTAIGKTTQGDMELFLITDIVSTDFWWNLRGLSGVKLFECRVRVRQLRGDALKACTYLTVSEMSGNPEANVEGWFST